MPTCLSGKFCTEIKSKYTTQHRHYVCILGNVRPIVYILISWPISLCVP